MAVYFITGKLGSWKTLCAVGRIREYLNAGRRVATNLDQNLSAMFGVESKHHYIRLPDKPRLQDMESIGLGCDKKTNLVTA
ncbi:MAG: zonular occludens toxin domain-containing protein [Methylococcales bacterium]